MYPCLQEISEAYSVLSDDAKRLLYDKGLLYKSIQAQQPAQYTNVNISNIAMRNAALWATLAQQALIIYSESKLNLY